ncbi:MAG: YtxH domain-containing protein [Myxococcales bacterium]|nr:YtxH domain-containing protein [Myxococcales bacterium]MCB9578960.1 YtxH domain-containing protein [Polyangiaceae bacterium]
MVPGLGAFALGVLAGAGLGLLLAPRSGKETRRAISNALSARIARLRGAG